MENTLRRIGEKKDMDMISNYLKKTFTRVLPDGSCIAMTLFMLTKNVPLSSMGLPLNRNVTSAKNLAATN